ncbi:MAG: HU family DNA-binding protein [Prevotella sp.]
MEQTISKADLINEIALHDVFANTSKSKVTLVVNHIFDTITGHLVDGNRVTVSGFGIFKTAVSSAKTAKVPGTERTVEVPAKTVAKFKASKALKDAVLASK